MLHMAKDMTKGAVFKPLVLFTIPLVLGNLFQLTYNAADSIIVGRFVSKEALAAVGAAAPVVNIIMFLVIGACLGAGVLMSEFFGANKMETLQQEVGTTLTAGGIFTTVLAILCVLFARTLLNITRVPQELLPLAVPYLRIICIGLLFTFLYNLFAAALRAVGDSRTPLLFLAGSAILNILADLFFIVVLQWGIYGAAIGTVLAEAVSAFLCMVYVIKKVPVLWPSRQQMKPEHNLLVRTVNYSWVTAMQQTALYVGKLLVQGNVNTLGVDTIAAFNAVNRIDDFAYTPQQNIGHAMTTFIAQNRGAKKYDRIDKGFFAALVLEVCYFLFIMITVLLAAPVFMNWFVKDSPAVVNLGVAYLRTIAWMYLAPALTNWIQGYFRGMGDLRITLISTALQMIARVGFTFWLAPIYGIKGLAFACLGGWLCMLIFEVPVLLLARKRGKV